MYEFRVMPNGETGYIKRFDKGYSLYIICRADVGRMNKNSIKDICIKRYGKVIIDKPIHANLPFRDFGIKVSWEVIEATITEMRRFISNE